MEREYQAKSTSEERQAREVVKNIQEPSNNNFNQSNQPNDRMTDFSRSSESKAKPSMQDQAKKTNTITGMFTTTAVAVTVVAASTIFAGASDANIVKVKGFEDSIFYHVDVPYEDSYKEGSLKLIVESQLDEYEIALDFGESYGFLPQIETNTNYKVTLEVDGTLGSNSLGDVDVATAQGLQSVLYYPTISISEDQSLLQYDLRIYSEDVLSELTALTLKTTVLNPYTSELISLDDIPLALTDTSFSLTNIPNENRSIELKVVGTLATGEQIDIDTETIITPLKTTASGYVSSLSNKEAIYSLNPDFTYLIDPVYTVQLFDIDGELESIIIDQETDEPDVTFSNLYPNTKYGIQAIVEYTHPVTKVPGQIILSQDEFVTPDKLDVITSQTTLENSILYNITAEGNTSLYNQAYIKDDVGNITFYDITLLDANTIFIQIELMIIEETKTYEVGLSNDNDLFVVDTITIEGANQ